MWAVCWSTPHEISAICEEKCKGVEAWLTVLVIPYILHFQTMFVLLGSRLYELENQTITCLFQRKQSTTEYTSIVHTLWDISKSPGEKGDKKSQFSLELWLELRAGGTLGSAELEPHKCHSECLGGTTGQPYCNAQTHNRQFNITPVAELSF